MRRRRFVARRIGSRWDAYGLDSTEYGAGETCIQGTAKDELERLAITSSKVDLHVQRWQVEGESGSICYSGQLLHVLLVLETTSITVFTRYTEEISLVKKSVVCLVFDSGVEAPTE